MAPGWAAPFPAWPVPPAMYSLFSSENRSHHPSHLGARFRSRRVGDQRLVCAARGVRITILTICDTGYAKPPSYPIYGLDRCYFNNTLSTNHSISYFDGQPTVISSACNVQISCILNSVPFT